MKMKVKILVIALMAIFCIAPTSVPKAEAAGTLKTMYVHPSIWSVHGIYTKTSTGKIVYAKNASGFGKMEYCYGQVRSFFPIADKISVTRSNSFDAFRSALVSGNFDISAPESIPLSACFRLANSFFVLCDLFSFWITLTGFDGLAMFYLQKNLHFGNIS